MTPLVAAATYTVRRAAAGAVVSYEYVPGAESSFTVRASIAPATPEALQSAAIGGDRTAGTHLCYCATELEIGDRVEYGGVDCVVVAESDWDRNGSALRGFVYLLERQGADL